MPASAATPHGLDTSTAKTEGMLHQPQQGKTTTHKRHESDMQAPMSHQHDQQPQQHRNTPSTSTVAHHGGAITAAAAHRLHLQNHRAHELQLDQRQLATVPLLLSPSSVQCQVAAVAVQVALAAASSGSVPPALLSLISPVR
jgi:hypothetical protein